ncbi:putative transmembrane protein [Popillia japonica]|uniref:Transmembrane protein n=1 Tax=Popillia japonica TaxID=7064 RepID=A0AAW1JBR9_POPJA
MPGGSRRLPRTVRSTVTSSLQLIPGEIGCNRYSPLGAAVPTLPGLDHPTAPKHFPFPNTPVDSDLIFETLMYFFTITAAGLQFLHIYRSVWWLPHSYTSQAVNFYLIDLNLVIFILIILSRRVLYLLGCKLLDKIIPAKLSLITYHCYRLILFGTMLSILSWCAYYIVLNHPIMYICYLCYHVYYIYIVLNHPIMYICYLCYPIIVYAILFGFTIAPFFEAITWNQGEKPPLHACSTNAADIRSEVENLKMNFNNRLKQILFSSVFNACYAGFIPCCFVQNFVYYDVYWATQHVTFISLSCFTSYTNHILHLRYCDILHRSALHLGYWDKVETRSVLPVAYSWQEDMLWPNGALVRHGREMYRAHGNTNAAEPGNAAFTRFYSMFKNPSIALSGLFLIGRDYLVSMKIYKAEQALHQKLNSH